MKIQKTNAVRALDKAKVAYSLIPYTVDENDLSAVHVAQQVGLDAAQVFKTLLLQGDRGGYFVCLIPAAAALNLKKAAKTSGNKSCTLVPLKDLLPLTGYVRGGCSPLGMKKHYPTYIHESAADLPSLCVSAGQRGLQVQLAFADLVREVRAEVCDLV